MIKPVTKEKMKSLLRAQVEFDPEPVISQLEKDNFFPAINMLAMIVDDLHKRMLVSKTYCEKISVVFDEIKEQVS